MAQYRIFNEKDALVYARDSLDIFSEEADLMSSMLANGPLSLTFKVTDKVSLDAIIIKQALPATGWRGESRPVDTERTKIEAQVLQIHGRLCPEHTVKLIKYDESLCLLVLEDLSGYQSWRSALIAGLQYSGPAQQIARYLAKTLFYTSDFYLDPTSKKAQVAQFTNPDLCLITEDLLFTDPYRQHPRNQYNPQIEKEVAEIQNDFSLQNRVADLKYKFLNHSEALLHGGIHTGSLFVTPDNSKVVNAEFAYYGPAGFDLGLLMGNLLLNYASRPGLNNFSESKAFQAYLSTQLSQLWQIFETEFTHLLNEETQDPAFQLDVFQHKVIHRIFVDAIGFAGAELIRRIIGMLDAEDMMSIEDEMRRANCERLALALGRTLIMQAEQFETIDDVLDCINLVSKKFV